MGNDFYESLKHPILRQRVCVAAFAVLWMKAEMQRIK